MIIRTVSQRDTHFFDLGDAAIGCRLTVKGDGAYDGTYHATEFYWVERNGCRVRSPAAKIDAMITMMLPANLVGLAEYFAHRFKLRRLVTSDSTLIDYTTLVGKSDFGPVLDGSTLRFTTMYTVGIENIGQDWRCIEHRICVKTYTILSQTEIWKGLPTPKVWRI